MRRGTTTIFAIDHPQVEEQQQQPVFKDPSQKPVEDCLVEEIDQVFLFLCPAPSNHYCKEGIWRLHCTGKPTLLFEEVIPPVMQKESSVLSMNKRLIGLVPPVSIQTSLSCICICIWILFISYKYKRHSRVIW